MVSTFSWTLLAELAVGRIIRARKLSSAGLGSARGLASSVEPAIEGRDTVLALTGAVTRALEAVGSLVTAGLRIGIVLVLAASDSLDEPLVLAAEDAVGAVNLEGRDTGTVGDFGLTDELVVGFLVVGAVGFNAEVFVLSDELDAVDIRLGLVVVAFLGSASAVLSEPVALTVSLVAEGDCGEKVLAAGCLGEEVFDGGCRVGVTGDFEAVEALAGGFVLLDAFVPADLASTEMSFFVLIAAGFRVCFD